MDDDDSWDQIDWDKKVVDLRTKAPEEETAQSSFTFTDDGDNYFEINQARKKQQEEQQARRKNATKARARTDQREEMPHSYKDLREINSYRESEFHKMIFETFGNVTKLIATHEQELSDESLIELLKIDVALLEVPLVHHNRLLLGKLSKINSFWAQVIELIERFFETNCKDPKYLLLIDMKGLFENLESLLFWLIASNLMSSEMKEIFMRLLHIIGKHIDSNYFNMRRFHQVLQTMEQLSSGDSQLFDIFPSIGDLKSEPVGLEKNIIYGEYSDVLHYLKVQLPLLKEDFTCKLRAAFANIQSATRIDRVMKTHDATIFPNVQIEIEWHKLWNMNCPFILLRLDTPAKFFNGQMLCFTSSTNFNDLIVATVLKCGGGIETLDEHAVMIEIKRTENIKDIFNRDLIMVEPKAFFDPYHQVFAALRNLNEHNFPFKNRILKLERDAIFPKYEHSDVYEYKNFSLKVDSIEDWKRADLGLESMQVNAVYSGVSSDFSIIVGPPGTGKTFIGLELLRILLTNTDERILVLTQTNNALDKFLIGCLNFTQEIVRLGGQCKDDTLQPYVATTSIPFESRSYFKKLQAMQRDTVSRLMDSNESNEAIFDEISFHYRLGDEVSQLNSYCNIKEKRIFGMTTSYAAHNGAINKMLRPGIVIVEEASEIMESHILAALTRDTRHVIMIGDHHQLRPQTNSYELQRKFDFNISLFERLIMNELNYVALDVQRRMRPEFCDLVRATIYHDLKDGANVASYPSVRGMSGNFFCLNHNRPESASETSKENLFEIDFTLGLYRRLLEQGSAPGEIVILTPYAAQAKRFKQKLIEFSLPRVRVAVLDAYQGEESDIILLSLVRSNRNNDIGFLSMENRISVILSRAKRGFYICGNIDCLASASRTWRQIKEILVRHRAIADTVPADFGM